MATFRSDRCWLCGRNGSEDPLDRHHVYFSKGNKKKSEKYGAVVPLCHNRCHIFGPDSVHGNAKVDRALKAEWQKIIMDEYGLATEEFIREFHRNYL